MGWGERCCGCVPDPDVTTSPSSAVSVSPSPTVPMSPNCAVSTSPNPAVPHISKSHCPLVPTSHCPQFSLSPCPQIMLSPCPQVPCLTVPKSHCTCVSKSCYPQVPPSPRPQTPPSPHPRRSCCPRVPTSRCPHVKHPGRRPSPRPHLSPSHFSPRPPGCHSGTQPSPRLSCPRTPAPHPGVSLSLLPAVPCPLPAVPRGDPRSPAPPAPLGAQRRTLRPGGIGVHAPPRPGRGTGTTTPMMPRGGARCAHAQQRPLPQDYPSRQAPLRDGREISRGLELISPCGAAWEAPFGSWLPKMAPKAKKEGEGGRTWRALRRAGAGLRGPAGCGGAVGVGLRGSRGAGGPRGGAGPRARGGHGGGPQRPAWAGYMRAEGRTQPGCCERGTRCLRSGLGTDRPSGCLVRRCGPLRQAGGLLGTQTCFALTEVLSQPCRPRRRRRPKR